jgi:hypothetical protein
VYALSGWLGSQEPGHRGVSGQSAFCAGRAQITERRSSSKVKRHGLSFLLIASFSWGQAPGNGSATATQRPHETAGSSEVESSKPAITIAGLCEDSAERDTVSNCTTVITRAQFERVVNAIDPTMRRADRGQFALHYADVLVMAAKAEQMGLDKTPEFEEQMKLARIQALSQDLTKAIRERASQIPENDIEDFYHANQPRFEKAEFDRLYIPHNSVATEPVAAKSRLADSEQATKKEAENLRMRALAGEEFDTLQTDAFKSAGIKSAPPATGVSLRRISLPPDQVSVMDLKPGDISPVLSGPNGCFIYRLKAKSTLPLDQVRNEIAEALRTQQIHDETDGILNSAKSTLDESYFKR